MLKFFILLSTLFDYHLKLLYLHHQRVLLLAALPVGLVVILFAGTLVDPSICGFRLSSAAGAK